jgi:hypothetical protein
MRRAPPTGANYPAPPAPNQSATRVPSPPAATWQTYAAIPFPRYRPAATACAMVTRTIGPARPTASKSRVRQRHLAAMSVRRRLVRPPRSLRSSLDHQRPALGRDTVRSQDQPPTRRVSDPGPAGVAARLSVATAGSRSPRFPTKPPSTGGRSATGRR